MVPWPRDRRRHFGSFFWQYYKCFSTFTRNNDFLQLSRGVKQSFLLHGSVYLHVLQTAIKQPQRQPLNMDFNIHFLDMRPCQLLAGMKLDLPLIGNLWVGNILPLAETAKEMCVSSPPKGFHVPSAGCEMRGSFTFSSVA